MPTKRQIEANRLNAQKSTGPRTPEGKARSAMNALKSGLFAESQFVYGERMEDFALLQKEYFDRFQPLTPEKRFQVDRLIRNEWMLRRLFHAEPQLWDFSYSRQAISNGNALGEAWEKASQSFMRLQRRVILCERSYQEALTELERLQAVRQSQAKAALGPASEPQDPAQPAGFKPDKAKLASFRQSSLRPQPASQSEASFPQKSSLAPVPNGHLQFSS